MMIWLVTDFPKLILVIYLIQSYLNNDVETFGNPMKMALTGNKFLQFHWEVDVQMNKLV